MKNFIRSKIFFGSNVLVSSISQNTGLSPAYKIECDLETKEIGVVIISVFESQLCASLSTSTATCRPAVAEFRNKEFF